MFRRRRKYQGRWFPTDQNYTGYSILLAGTAPVVGFLDSLGNWTANANEATFTGAPNPTGLLATALVNGFTAKRVVGSIFCAIGGSGTVGGVVAAAGLTVIRGDSSSNTAGLPAGDDSYNPLKEAGAQRRWLWRRVWMLGNFQDGTASHGTFNFPTTNAGYGSVREGTHIDWKGGARVGYGERLAWVFSRIVDNTAGSTTTVTFIPNVRLFAKPNMAGPR